MTSVGMCAQTGQTIYGDACINQSIRRLLSTEHDLVLRRHLAANITPLVDEPGNAYTFARIRGQIAEAILQGEPRANLQTIDVISETPGVVAIMIKAISRESGQPLTVAWPEQAKEG